MLNKQYKLRKPQVPKRAIPALPLPPDMGEQIGFLYLVERHLRMYGDSDPNRRVGRVVALLQQEQPRNFERLNTQIDAFLALYDTPAFREAAQDNSKKWQDLAQKILGDFLGASSPVSRRTITALANDLSQGAGLAKYENLVRQLALVIVAQQFPGLVSPSPTGRKRKWNELNLSFALLQHEKGRRIARQRLSDARDEKRTDLRHSS